VRKGEKVGVQQQARCFRLKRRAGVKKVAENRVAE
jgi:hypothetical protein